MLDKICKDTEIFDQRAAELLRDKPIVSTFNPPLRYCPTQEIELKRRNELNKKLKFAYQLKQLMTKGKVIDMYEKCNSWISEHLDLLYNDLSLRSIFEDQTNPMTQTY